MGEGRSQEVGTLHAKSVQSKVRTESGGIGNLEEVGVRIISNPFDWT